MNNDIVFGFILGLLFGALCLLFIELIKSHQHQDCFNQNNKDMPSFEERIRRINEYEKKKEK
jgi:hypothetical protein